MNDVPKSVKDVTKQEAMPAQTGAALAPCTKYFQPILPWVCVQKQALLGALLYLEAREETSCVCEPQLYQINR